MNVWQSLLGQRRRRAAIAGTVVAVLVLAVIVVVVTHRSTGRTVADTPSPSPLTPSSTPPPPSSSARPTPSRTASTKPAPTVAPAAAVRAALSRLAAQRPPGGVSVAALNTKTGKQFSYGMTSGMRTGSVAKLFLLEAVLLQHQDAGTPLSDYELSLATPMIENSDNKAEYSLFLNSGGNETLEDAFPRLGLKHTVPGVSDPALTTTDATDGVRLVQNLVRSNAPLNSYSRSLALGLMRNVQSDQRWGVSAVADPGTPVALKNGWLSVDNNNGPGENDDGRWLVNSVGVVTVHGQQVLLAAFTQHGPDYASGIKLVESLVKTITPAVVAD